MAPVTTATEQSWLSLDDGSDSFVVKRAEQNKKSLHSLALIQPTLVHRGAEQSAAQWKVPTPSLQIRKHHGVFGTLRTTCCCDPCRSLRHCPGQILRAGHPAESSRLQ